MRDLDANLHYADRYITIKFHFHILSANLQFVIAPMAVTQSSKKGFVQQIWSVNKLESRGVLLK